MGIAIANRKNRCDSGALRAPKIHCPKLRCRDEIILGQMVINTEQGNIEATLEDSTRLET